MIVILTHLAYNSILQQASLSTHGNYASHNIQKTYNETIYGSHSFSLVTRIERDVDEKNSKTHHSTDCAVVGQMKKKKSKVIKLKVLINVVKKRISP